MELDVGDCFNAPSSGSAMLVDQVTVVPCAEPHDFEVYHAFDLTGDAFPGDDVIEDRWISGCLDRFEPFVGIPFDQSVLDISAIFPTEETWESLDDREVVCSVTAVSGEPRSGSAAGSAQ